jgi:hypothetical protein
VRRGRAALLRVRALDLGAFVGAGDQSRLSKLRLRIEDPPRRKHMVFLGASVLGGLIAEGSVVRWRGCWCLLP